MKNAQQVANELVNALNPINPEDVQARRAVAASFVSAFQAATAPVAGLSVWIQRALPSLGIEPELVEQLSQSLSL